MRKVSLEKEIAGIINQESIEKKCINTYWGNVTVKTVNSGNFKCTFPVSDQKEILARSRRLMRKPILKEKIPESQKILYFLSIYKEIIPLYVEMVKKNHTSLWFRRRVWEIFPKEAKEILDKSYFGISQSDRMYAISTMPRAWGQYKTTPKNTAVKQAI